MVCRNAVLPEPILRNGTNICLAYEENTRTPYTDNLCFFRAPVHNLHDTQRLEEENPKFFNLLIKKMDGWSADQLYHFQGVHMHDILFVEDLLTLNILLYDIDIVEGKFIGELARPSVQK